MVSYNYACKVIRVVDGDTFIGEVDLGFGIKVKKRFRVAHLDTPETWRPETEAEREHGHRATLRAKELLEGKDVEINTMKQGKYGRYIADVWCIDPAASDIGLQNVARNFAAIMIEEDFQKTPGVYVDNPKLHDVVDTFK